MIQLHRILLLVSVAAALGQAASAQVTVQSASCDAIRGSGSSRITYDAALNCMFERGAQDYSLLRLRFTPSFIQSST